MARLRRSLGASRDRAPNRATHRGQGMPRATSLRWTTETRDRRPSLIEPQPFANVLHVEGKFSSRHLLVGKDWKP